MSKVNSTFIKVKLRSVVNGNVIEVRDDGYGMNNPNRPNGGRQHLIRLLSEREVPIPGEFYEAPDGEKIAVTTPVWFPVEVPTAWTNKHGATFQPDAHHRKAGVWGPKQDEILKILGPLTAKRVREAGAIGNAQVEGIKAKAEGEKKASKKAAGE